MLLFLMLYLFQGSIHASPVSFFQRDTTLPPFASLNPCVCPNQRSIWAAWLSFLLAHGFPFIRTCLRAWSATVKSGPTSPSTSPRARIDHRVGDAAGSVPENRNAYIGVPPILLFAPT